MNENRVRGTLELRGAEYIREHINNVLEIKGVNTSWWYNI